MVLTHFHHRKFQKISSFKQKLSKKLHICYWHISNMSQFLYHSSLSMVKYYILYCHNVEKTFCILWEPNKYHAAQNHGSLIRVYRVSKIQNWEAVFGIVDIYSRFYFSINALELILEIPFTSENELEVDLWYYKHLSSYTLLIWNLYCSILPYRSCQYTLSIMTCFYWFFFQPIF